MASLVAEHGLWDSRASVVAQGAQYLRLLGSRAQTQLLWCMNLVAPLPGAGAPPVAKVMRKEAQHTQRRDRASGVPLEILEHLPPKPESAYFLLWGWDGWMASPTWWAWVWVNSGSWWWTGRPGVLQFMGSQRVRHDWATDLIWSEGSNSCPLFGEHGLSATGWLGKSLTILKMSNSQLRHAGGIQTNNWVFWIWQPLFFPDAPLRKDMEVWSISQVDTAPGSVQEKWHLTEDSLAIRRETYLYTSCSSFWSNSSLQTTFCISFFKSQISNIKTKQNSRTVCHFTLTLYLHSCCCCC